LSTTSVVQLEFEPLDESFSSTGASTSALKLQAAEHLAAHRARRGRATAPALAQPTTASTRSNSRAERIAAAVAERYAQSQSYRAFLAAEAERAIQQAQATAEVAVRTAEAIVATQQQLLSELGDWNAQPTGPALVEASTSRVIASEPTAATLTVRLYEDVGRSATTGTSNAVPHEFLDEEDRLALEEEIAFRHSPTIEHFLEPATAIPANLIEFPRQLVASRKARPRLAEGPLRDEADLTPDHAQLRIFEVQPEQISIEPSNESVLPEWSSIRLDAHTISEEVVAPEDLVTYAAAALLTAPIGLRMMAAIVDGCLVAAGFLGFTAVASQVAGELPTGQAAALAAVVTLAVLFVTYQLLFFTFSDATPGMRYARIGLCTFSDDNPTRSAMRRRLLAIALAACPAGLGLLWALLDDDRLGWHDRISGMYQRSY
jgi:uncharacterized RDD family membrane protein YckC